MTEQRNERTSHQRGLNSGYDYAETAVESGVDIFDLEPIADGRIDDDLCERITAQVVESGDIEDPKRFWDGFAHGVAAYLVDYIFLHDPKPAAGD